MLPSLFSKLCRANVGFTASISHHPDNFMEGTMGSVDIKALALRQHYALHRHPAAVRASPFQRDIPFFDARDLIQVRYELLRAVKHDHVTVTEATKLFGCSRTTYYSVAAAWEHAGFLGLLPEPPGPRGGSKLSDEILNFLQGEAPSASSEALARLVAQHFRRRVHPRSIERARARQTQKGGPRC